MNYYYYIVTRLSKKTIDYNGKKIVKVYHI